MITIATTLLFLGLLGVLSGVMALLSDAASAAGRLRRELDDEEPAVQA